MIKLHKYALNYLKSANKLFIKEFGHGSGILAHPGIRHDLAHPGIGYGPSVILELGTVLGHPGIGHGTAYPGIWHGPRSSWNLAGFGY